MTRGNNRGGARSTRHDRAHGQMIVLFALSLMAMLAMAGLLVDGGMAWVNRREAQAAADTATLAAAVALSEGKNLTQARAEAEDVASDNGFAAGNRDCAGNVLANGGVTVNWPPSSAATPDHRNTGFVEVTTTKAMGTAFAGAVGQPCWMVSARAVASIKSHVVECSFCSLSDWQGDDRYVLLIDNGNDLRVDGGIFSNHSTWYEGTPAVNRCGTNPCNAASCGDWNGLPSNHNILMCGHNIYVDHSGGGTPTILSAKTIAAAGGWQARNSNDVIHADEKTAVCPGSPRYLGYPTTFLQETNVCIGVPQVVDPLNDPNHPADIMPLPDYENLSTCPGDPFPCGPVESASCQAEPGTTLALTTGTFLNPDELTISGGAWQRTVTICPGIYYGGFSTTGDGNAQPHVIMLPGTYVMVGGGFSVRGTASITTVSSLGDGVTIYNTGGSEAFSENFPSDPALLELTCPPPVGSTCEPTGSLTFQPPGNGIAAGNPVTYRLTVPKGAGALPRPTGTAAEFAFYNGSAPIACEGGIVVTTPNADNLVAECTTHYTTFGTKGITAVYAGDAVYAPNGKAKNQDVDPPPGSGHDNIDLRTTSGPCAAMWASEGCGQIVLHAPIGGRYSGLLIFQDRAPGQLQGSLGILLRPFAGAPACDMTPVSTPVGTLPVFMADGVPAYGPPFDSRPVPAPCGPIGGLSGTIYAAHTAGPGMGSPSDWDVVVNLMGSGLAEIQIISAEIFFTQGNPSNQARIAFDASKFANGMLHLVE